MLVKDGKEINPDEPEEEEEAEEPKEPEVELTDDEVMEALRIYGEMKKREKTQQLKPAEKPAQEQQDSGYGDYEYVKKPQSKQEDQDDDDYDDDLVGFPAVIASMKKLFSGRVAFIAVAAVGIAILLAAVVSWKNGSRGEVQPTSATQQAVQPAQPAANTGSCTVVSSPIASKADIAQNGFPNCILTLSDGATVTYPGACSDIPLNVGDSASYCK